MCGLAVEGGARSKSRFTRDFGPYAQQAAEKEVKGFLLERRTISEELGAQCAALDRTLAASSTK
jgi:hypothetical protein